MAVFIKVVEMGSFSQAARQLGMPNSTVSAKVSDLETRLGISLMKRTTRKLFVTEEGRRFYERCTRGLEEIKAAEEELISGKKEPQGLLRLTAPVDLGGALLPEVLCDFKKKYPKVVVELFLSDRVVDLVSEGFDLAIRAGELKDSSFFAKKLGTVYFAPFASPSYLRKAGAPEGPKDLQHHSCLQFTPLGSVEWKMIGPKGSVSVPVTRQMIINDLNTLKALTINGSGVAFLPTYLCLAEISNKKLVRLLPEWRSGTGSVHFVYGGQKQTPPKVSAFIEVAGDIIKKRLRADDV